MLFKYDSFEQLLHFRFQFFIRTDWGDTVNDVSFKNVSSSNAEVELSCFKCDPPVEFVTHDELKTHLEEKHPEV